MHLRNVEIFCEVVTRRSFSKAAEVFGVSQSAASQAVMQLEKRLNTTLLDRSKRPFELTQAGEIYYQGCRDLISQFREIEDRVQQVGNKVTGRIRIAAIYSVVLSDLEQVARAYRQAYPDVHLNIEYLHPSVVYERLDEDECELGLVSFPERASDFQVIPLDQEPIVVAVPMGHPFCDRTSLQVKDLDGQRFIGFSTALRIRREIDRWLRQHNVSISMVHEFDNVENVKRDVEIGSGISLLPAPTLKREVQTGTLHALQLEDARWFRPIAILHRKGRTLNSATTRFVEMLQASKSAQTLASGHSLSFPTHGTIQAGSQAQAMMDQNASLKPVAAKAAARSLEEDAEKTVSVASLTTT